MMLYEVVHSSQVVPAPPTSNVVEYLYNHGGLNNQKMAFIGLLINAIEHGLSLNLPYMYLKDQKSVEEILTNFANVFEIEAVHEFARRKDVRIIDGSPGGKRDGWDHFRHFSDRLSRSLDNDVIETILGGLASLKPKMISLPVYQKLRSFVFAAMKIQTVVQLRIEDDWVDHAKALRPILHNVEDYNIGFVEILAKIRKTFPTLDNAYVTADEASMPVPKEEIRALARGRFDLGLVWKSDFLTSAEIGNMNSFDHSIVDFEIAKTAPRFIGMSNSTFSNMACLEKFAKTRKTVTGHFIYNHPGDLVMERKDNGFMVSAYQAVRPSNAEIMLSNNQVR
ncbi:hypothetical protein [Rhodopila sp.]|uniref:hypothetical protein n=1 Tax=Rhodopila sp. TaxID=2480087 RepID=UPI003D0ABE0C